ncbi:MULTISPECIES: PilZ domain-containing protein [Marinobacter]|uniref:PilZ domain-containing protein n=1 Tax=Marinobacter TaxID=2742 RepID=UPI0013A6A9D5|nr:MULTISPECIES: PilZ domain-containing protein [Marinobacter]
MTERRRRERLPFIRMGARIRVRRHLFTNRWLDVAVRDFSRMGMAIIAEQEFEEGDIIQFSLRLDTEVGDITVKQALGVVRNARVDDEGTIYGIEFAGDQRPSVTESLSRIESVLSRFRAVSERMR